MEIASDADDHSTKTSPTNESSEQQEHVCNNRDVSPRKALALNGFLGYSGANLPSQDADSLNKVDVTLITILGIGSIYLIVTSALATPVLHLSSLSVHKFNERDIDAKLNLAGTWDVKLTVQNVEMWRGSYSVTNCTLYVQIEKRSYYEEEARNLVVAAKSNGIANESFSLMPKEEKEVKLRMNDVGAREGNWESTSFALIVSVHVGFDQPKYAGLGSGMAYYECDSLTMDTKTSMLSNEVPMFCHLTAPLFK